MKYGNTSTVSIRRHKQECAQQLFGGMVSALPYACLPMAPASLQPQLQLNNSRSTSPPSTHQRASLQPQLQINARQATPAAHGIPSLPCHVAYISIRPLYGLHDASNVCYEPY